MVSEKIRKLGRKFVLPFRPTTDLPNSPVIRRLETSKPSVGTMNPFIDVVQTENGSFRAIWTSPNIDKVALKDGETYFISPTTQRSFTPPNVDELLENVDRKLIELANSSQVEKWSRQNKVVIEILDFFEKPHGDLRFEEAYLAGHYLNPKLKKAFSLFIEVQTMGVERWRAMPICGVWG